MNQSTSSSIAPVSSTNTMRGALIVVEGLDKAGKSTQCERLCVNLENDGHKVKRMRFPDRSTPIGKSIDAYLKGEAQIEDHVIHLLFSANRWEAAAEIRNDIAQGTTVVIDRYYYSGVVYSAAKNNPELTLEWARQPEVGLPQPDLCLFLKIAPLDAERREGFGDERYETTKMQERVRDNFQKLFSLPVCEPVLLIDAGFSVEKVEQKILKKVVKHFQKIQWQLPLGSVQTSFTGHCLMWPYVE